MEIFGFDDGGQTVSFEMGTYLLSREVLFDLEGYRTHYRPPGQEQP